MPKSAVAYASTACVALLAAAIILPMDPARAQTPNSGVSIGPSEGLAAPNAPQAPTVEHLFGDWGGLRTKLENAGINITADWVAEVAGNTGGAQQGATYAGQVGLQVDADWNKLLQIPGLQTHVVVVNRQGSLDSTIFGDKLNPTQEIYGAGGNAGIHFVYGYAEEALLNGRVNIAVGRMPLLNDFAASPLYCNFMNNSLCGNPKLLPSADIGISSYPDSVWGGRVRVRPTEQTYIQVGAYEVNQTLYGNKYFRSNFDFSSAGSNGAEIPVEIAYEPVIGAAKLPGHYKLGFAYDTAQNNGYFSSIQAINTGVRPTGNKSEFWALADQMVYRNGPGSLDGITLLAGYMHSDGSLSSYNDQVFAGVIDHGFWRARPQDQIALLVNYTNISGAYAREQELDLAAGLPLLGGATGVQTSSVLMELNYNIHVGHGIDFAPDFQYYFRPNAQANIKDAAVFGFKSHVNF